MLQNLVHRLTYKSELARVRTFMKLARQAAWGTNQETWPAKMESSVGKPRKVKVNIKGNPDIEGEEQEYLPGRMIEMLVEGEEVYLVSIRVLLSLPSSNCSSLFYDCRRFPPLLVILPPLYMRTEC
jgi:DnaJ homolog subfamily C member 1